MFIPKLFRSEDFSVFKKIIDENGFALVISTKEKLLATHTMMLLNEDEENIPKVEVHISQANPQAKILKDGDSVLLDFLGANTYISSSWYGHTNASTWDYEAVQIYGTVKVMNHDELHLHLDKLTNKYEKSQSHPMDFVRMGEEFVEKEMKGAFGFFVIPTEIHIAQKLSQNRNDEDYKNIITHLESSQDANANAIAKKMRKLRKI